MRGWWLVVCLAGCLEDQLLQCGDLLCPVGSVCTATGCVAAADVAACNGLDEGAPCRSGVGRSGVCASGVCAVTECGNGTIDLGERCDGELGVDVAAGESCSTDCRMIERCGDGIVYGAEACDDGNSNPSDACDACVATAWQPTVKLGGTANALMIGIADPAGVTFDRNGNLYIAEQYQDSGRVWRVDANGVMTRIAGTGINDFTGDGGPATSAAFGMPSGVAVDGLGQVFIADSLNNRIRKVDLDGIVTTIAGSSYTDGFGGDGGPATAALMHYPYDVAVDGVGNVYIADEGNSRIRRVDATTGTITTVVGTGTCAFSGDNAAATAAAICGIRGIALDQQNNLYIADTGNHRVRKVNAITGTIVTVAGNGTSAFSGDGGPATSAGMSAPAAVAVDGAGTIYIADLADDRIRKVDANGTITTIAGTGTSGFSGDGGPATAAELQGPIGIAVDASGRVVFSDGANYRIRQIGTDGIITTVAGTGGFGDNSDGSSAVGALIYNPLCIGVDGAGNFYFADSGDNRIRKVDANGVLTTIAGNLGRSGFGGDGGPAVSAELAYPDCVAVDPAGNVFVADTQNHRIRKIDTNGIITTVAGSGTPSFGGDNGPATSASLNRPEGLAVDAAGALYIADTSNNRIRKVVGGTITTVAGNGSASFGADNVAATTTSINHPLSVAVDGAGTIYIADTDNHRVRKVTGGTITTIAGTGVSGYNGDGIAGTTAKLASPGGVAVDAQGNVYIADTSNDRVRQLTAGTITTIAGDGVSDYTGDGGPAVSAEAFLPFRVAVDSAGRVYFSEQETIRRISGGIVTVVAGPYEPSGVGPLAVARIADARALALGTSLTFYAGGNSGTVEAASATALFQVAGRWWQSIPTGELAKYRDYTFGDVGGVAYDGASTLYFTETSQHRVHEVHMVDPANPDTWTIAALNASTTPGFADGALATAKFRDPSGLYYEAGHLYVADTGNHVIRSIDLLASTVSTVAGTAQTRGFFGDGGPASSALLYRPSALTRCANGDWYVADTGNQRVRRVAGDGTISTVLGDGVFASSGEGRPATSFPVASPFGIACDALGNVFVTSTSVVRMLPSNDAGVVDGLGPVETIYGAPPQTRFPESVTRCLTGIAVKDPVTLELLDSCSGMQIELSLVKP